MSLKSFKVSIAALALVAMSILFSSMAFAEEDNRRYNERYDTGDEWAYAMLLYSPEFNGEYAALWHLWDTNTVAIDTFGDYSTKVWKYMHTIAADVDEGRYTPWVFPTLNTDIVPFADMFEVKRKFTAIFLVRENSLFDLYDLMDEGWYLADLHHPAFDRKVVKNRYDNSLKNLFEPMEFDGFDDPHTIYRIPVSELHVFD